MDELHTGLRKLAPSKCSDEQGVNAEILQHGSELFHILILQCYNDIIAARVFPDDWHHTIFKILPKSGDLLQLTIRN